MSDLHQNVTGLKGDGAARPVRVTEPAIIGDTLVTGILPLERRDGIVRITFYTERSDPEYGEIVRVIADRLVMAEPTFRALLRQLVDCPADMRGAN